MTCVQHMEPETLLAMKIPPKPTNNDRPEITELVEGLLSDTTAAMVVMIEATKGSTPRDAQAVMIVTEAGFTGSVGGGQLEWIALEQARKLMTAGTLTAKQSIPLGPQIGQCCGGSVELVFEKLTPRKAEHLKALSAAVRVPSVQIHGAGHTGKALAKALALLPFDVSLIDSRPDQLAGMDGYAGVHATALPEEIVHNAAPETAFIILTHEHRLDFLLTAEALQRGDAAYVGMIGSSTKRAVFTNWLAENRYDSDLAKKLVCPIGGNSVTDKRPEIIAALVAAELIKVFSSEKRNRSSLYRGGTE